VIALGWVDYIQEKIFCQGKSILKYNPSVMGDQKRAIRQEYFQSFMTRIVKMLATVLLARLDERSFWTGAKCLGCLVN
jgi:hypothetical protein